MNEELTPLTRREEFLSAAAGEGECPDPLTRIEMFLSAAAGEGECPTPVTRLEEFLAAAAGVGEAPDPVTRVEMFLAAISGKGEAPEPVTRLEMFLAGWAEGGGGVIKTITGNAPLTFEALAAALVSLTQDGKTVQDGTPTPDAPVDIVCNNGTLMMRHRSGLPNGYKLLEYVGGSGSQYVITDTYLASTDVIECEYKNSSTTGYGAIYGIYKTGESTALYGNQTYYGYDQANNKVDTEMSVDTEWHSARHDFANGTLTIDDTTTNFTPWAFTNTTKNAVLSRFYNGSYGYNWKGFVRKFKVMRGNEVICDLLPAKNSNDVAGLYDLISGSFYTATGGTLLEGDVVDDYELIVDGTPEVLSVGGKNLNGGTIENKGYTSTGGESTSTTFAGTLWQIPCVAGQKFTVSWGGFPDGVSGVFINTWKTDGTWNARQAISASTSLTYTIGAGVGLVNFTLYKTGGITIGDNAWLQVEYGETATDYEPYRAPQTASVADLYAVGDYKDTQEIIGGAVNRKVGVAVLTGKENVSTSNSCYTISISDRLGSKTALLCSHFPYSNKTSSQTEDQTIISFSSTNIGFRYDACADKTAFAAWLAAQYAAGTPVIVLYPLAEETTESVQGQALRTEKGGNAISVVSNVDPVNLTVEYKGAKE